MTTPNNPPAAIYLQWTPDEDERESVIEPEGEGVTWCEDKIYRSDIRYVIDKRYKRNRRGEKAEGR